MDDPFIMPSEGYLFKSPEEKLITLCIANEILIDLFGHNEDELFDVNDYK